MKKIRARWVAVSIVLAVLCGLSAASIATAPPVERDNPAPPAAVLISADAAAPLTPVTDQPVRHSPESLPHNTVHGYHCEDALRNWRNSNGDQRFTVRVEHCAPLSWAALQQLSIENDATSSHLILRAAPNILFGIATTGQYQGVWLTQILFRKGPFVVQVTVTSPQREDAQLSVKLQDLALLQWNRTPGTPERPLQPIDVSGNFADITTATALLVFVLFVSVQLVGWIRERRRGHHLVSHGPSDEVGLAWRDAGPRARQLARGARIRFWATITAILVVFALPIDAVTKSIVNALLPARLVLSGRFQPGQRKLWGRHGVSQLKTGQNKRATSVWFTAAVLLLMATILTLVAVGVVVRLIVAAAASTGPVSTGAVGPNLRWDPTVVADAGIFQPLRLMSAPALAADMMGVAIVLALAMSSCYRRARRLAALDTIERLRTDTRSPIIYLRNFADDAVTIRTSPLTRRSALDKISLQQFESFEEVLVRYLTTFGPVTAVNNPKHAKAPLGAARESLSHDDWQDTVTERIKASALIVVGAGPAAPTSGLRWELETIAACGALPRTLFVLPPHPAAELDGRWSIFRAMAARLSVPERTAEHVDRLLLLHTDEDGRWTAWHADTRTDWAYAVALSGAAQQVIL